MDLEGFRQRDFPPYTIWGLFIAAAGLVSTVTYGSWPASTGLLLPRGHFDP